MYTIGIAGHSGSGKTKVAETLREKLSNSKSFEGDAYMYQSFIDLRPEAERLFNKDFIKPDGSLSFTCVINSETNGREYMQLLCPYISENLKKEQERARQEGYDYFIVDWQALSMLDFWELCDKKIVTQNLPEQRYDMLSKRPIHGCSPEMAKKREDFFRYAFENLGSDVILLFNDYTANGLNLALSTIINAIQLEAQLKDREIDFER